jgi:o-succinylbenzoate---CoA ligase
MSEGELNESDVLRPWIHGVAPADFRRRLSLARRRLEMEPGAILVVEKEAVDFLVLLFAAVLERRTVVLGSGAWGEGERKQVARILPGLDGGSGEILIPTGGSGGELRFARHTWATLAAAAGGFAKFFQVSRVDSLCVLPLFHVSGLMQAVRSLVSGGVFYPLAWKEVEAGRWPAVEAAFMSLVPTQLQRLMAGGADPAGLGRLRAILLGGAAAPQALLEAAAENRLPLALSYGMTETAAMVTALRPEAFLAGRRDCGVALSHTEIAVDDGRILVRASSLFHGYVPGERRGDGWWETGDLGELGKDGALTVFGRAGRWIVSGGEKIALAEVERAVLRNTGAREIFAFGVDDEEWGHALAVAYVPGAAGEVDLRGVLQGKLAPHKVPKFVYVLEELPLTQTGKIDRALLAEISGRRLVAER